MKQRSIAADTVWFNLMEAHAQLTVLCDNLDDNAITVDRYSLEADLEHTFHHLNYAWNARHGHMPEVDNSWRRFRANEKWPRATPFLRFWPNRVAKAIRMTRKQGKSKGEEA